jgi:hypothetical protein
MFSTKKQKIISNLTLNIRLFGNNRSMEKSILFLCIKIHNRFLLEIT